MAGEEPQIYSEDLEKQTLFAAVHLSLDIQDFIQKHPAGKILMARASEELIHARSALEDVSPEDTKKIVELQIQAASARKAIMWLGEAISNGNEAESQLTLQED